MLQTTPWQFTLVFHMYGRKTDIVTLVLVVFVYETVICVLRGIWS